MFVPVPLSDFFFLSSFFLFVLVYMKTVFMGFFCRDKHRSFEDLVDEHLNEQIFTRLKAIHVGFFLSSASEDFKLKS